MKKKILFALLVVGLGWTVVNAATEQGVPQGPENALMTADYGGVLVAVSTFSSAAKQAFVGVGLVYGVYFSSGPSSDFVTIRDSNTANTISSETVRMYNTATSTCGTNGGPSGGFNWLRYPIKLQNGASFNSNSATYNNANLLYWPLKP